MYNENRKSHPVTVSSSKDYEIIADFWTRGRLSKKEGATDDGHAPSLSFEIIA